MYPTQRKWFNLGAFALMVVLNGLANGLPLNHKTTGQLSDQYPNLFVPAGLTFAIWGVIYLLLLGIVLLPFIPKYKHKTQDTGPWFAINALCNALWIVAWHYEYLVVSILLIALIFISLIAINKNLNGAGNNLECIGFGIYLGWICIALPANLTAAWVHFGWPVFGISEPGWAAILIFAGLAAGLVLSWNLYNPYPMASIAWALLGIYLKRSGDYEDLSGIALGAAVVALLSGIIFWLRKPILAQNSVG